MKYLTKNRLFFAFIFLLSFSITRTLAQDDDNSVNIVPGWSKGEKHTVQFTSTIINQQTGGSGEKKYESVFTVQFTVAEVSEQGYLLNWTYTGAQLDENDPQFENRILARLKDRPLQIRLSDVGQFTAFVNATEIKPIVDQALDELVQANAADPAKSTQYKAYKQAIATPDGLEAIILKQVKVYFFSFGYNFTLKKVDGVAVKEAVKSFLLKNNPGHEKAIEDQLGNAPMEFSEFSFHEVNYAKGIVLKGQFKRITSLSIQNRTAILDMASRD